MPYNPTPFSTLVGKILTDIQITRSSAFHEDSIVFVTDDGASYKMSHWQDCCESVTIEDIVGDTDDLLNAPILRAEERTAPGEYVEDYKSETYTFYEIATIFGSVTIRWHGTSNGYYSEGVDFELIDPRPGDPSPRDPAF